MKWGTSRLPALLITALVNVRGVTRVGLVLVMGALISVRRVHIVVEERSCWNN